MVTAPRWQKVLSDLWSNRIRSLLVIASISIGLFAIGIIATIYIVISADMRTGYTAVYAPNIYIQTDSIDQDMVEHLQKADGVEQAEGIRMVDLRISDKDNQWQSLHLQAAQDWVDMPFNRVALKQGVWPPGEDEIVLDQYKLPDLNAKLGDLVRIEMPDGNPHELRLVGVVQDISIGAYDGGGGFFHAPVWGFVTQDTLVHLGLPAPYTYNGLFAAIQGPKDNLDLATTVTQRLTDHMEGEGVIVISTKIRSAYEHPNAYLVNAIVGVLFVLGLLVVFLSGFLITSTLQALLGQQIQQIGIMKSLGARWMQVAGIYMMLIFILGLLAFLLAAPSAGSISFWPLSFLAGKLNFVLQGYRLIPGAVIIQAALALIIPQAAAWLPIWKGTRISVQEALSGMKAVKMEKGERAKGGSTGTNPFATPTRRDFVATLPASGRGAFWWNKLSWGSGSPFPRLEGGRGVRSSRWLSRPLLISLRNTFRRKGRLALTLVTLTLGGAIFIATFNVQVSMSKYGDQIAQYFLSDVSVSVDKPYRISRIQTLLRNVPGVDQVEGWAAARSELVQADGSSGESVNLLAPPAGSKMIRPILISGRWIQPGDRNTIVLGELFQSRFPGLKIGDTLTLQVNGDKTDFRVVGFFRFAGKNGGYTAYTDFDYLSELTGQTNRATNFQIAGSRPDLSPAEQDRLAQAIEACLKAEGIQVSDISTGSFLKGVFNSGFNILITFLLFLAVLTALVGSIGLTGTMSMNVMERTREIGVMRAIGASDRMLMKLVLTEGMLIGATSYGLGALLAFPISKLMSDGISLALFEAPSTFGFTPTGFAIWLAVVIVLSFAASVIPARNASRLTIREVLAYE